MPIRRSRRLRPHVALVLLTSLGVVAATAGGGRAAHAQGPGPWCGGQLWRLMTLSDPERARVRLHGRQTTVAAIAKLERPGRVPAARATPFQRQVWRLQAVVDRYRIASNGEIVLILYSIQSGQYMDTYLPNPSCLGERARDRTGMIAARRSFTSRCPRATAAWELLGVTVDVAGVGFWNPSLATRGALSNGAELRPLTNLRIVSGCGVG